MYLLCRAREDATDVIVQLVIKETDVRPIVSLHTGVTTQLSGLNNVVKRTMLFTCSLLFQQCCSAFINEETTVVEKGENNIDRTSLFVIVTIVAQPC